MKATSIVEGLKVIEDSSAGEFFGFENSVFQEAFAFEARGCGMATLVMAALASQVFIASLATGRGGVARIYRVLRPNRASLRGWLLEYLPGV